PRVLGQPVDDRRVAVKTDSRMQEQERTPASFFDCLQAHAVDRYGRWHILYCRQIDPTLEHFQSIPLLYYAKSAAPMEIAGAAGRPVAAAALGESVNDPTCDIHKNLTYANHDGIDLQGDLYLPPGPGPFPVIVNVHGG